MKRFILNICLYIFAILLVVIPPEIYKIVTNADLGSIAGREVRTAVKISKTKTNKKVKKLILGDSTGHALYPCEKEYEGMVSLACNRAIAMSGQYFLLYNYLLTNQDNLPEEIVLLYSPFSFSNDLDKYTYQYFLKPFPVKEYKPLYTNHLYNRIKTIPLYWTANLPFIQTSSYTPRIAVPANERGHNMSELSMEYLLKIDALAKEYNVPFSILATPVRDDKKVAVKHAEDEFRNACSEYLKEDMENYIQSIKYYPSKLFFDEVHLIDEEVPQDYLGILNEKY